MHRTLPGSADWVPAGLDLMGVHAPHVVLGSDAGLWRPPARARQTGVVLGGASECPAEPGEDVRAHCGAAMTMCYCPGL